VQTKEDVPRIGHHHQRVVTSSQLKRPFPILSLSVHLMTSHFFAAVAPGAGARRRGGWWRRRHHTLRRRQGRHGVGGGRAVASRGAHRGSSMRVVGACRVCALCAAVRRTGRCRAAARRRAVVPPQSATKAARTAAREKAAADLGSQSTVHRSCVVIVVICSFIVNKNFVRNKFN